MSGAPARAGEFELNVTAYNNVDSVTSTLKLNVAGTNDPDPDPDPLPHNVVGSSGSGCNSGVNMMMLVFAVMVFMKVRSR